MHNGFEDLDLDRLRRRRSEKWRLHPPDVLPAFIAEMDYDLAEPVVAALRAAVDRSDCGYATLDGIGETFAAFAAARHGWTVDPGRVHLVPDVMAGFDAIVALATEPGDGVVINPPVYPPFFQHIGFARRRVVEVPLVREGGRWELDFAGLEAAFAAGARAYLLCNPHNPTGRVFTPADLGRIASLAEQYGVLVLADEIHASLTLPGARHTPFVSLGGAAAEHGVTLASASKAFNVAGLKGAVAVAGSAAMERLLARLPASCQYGAGLFGVLASLAAWDSGADWLDALLGQLDHARTEFALLGSGCRGGYAPEASNLLIFIFRAAKLIGQPYGSCLGRVRFGYYQVGTVADGVLQLLAARVEDHRHTRLGGVGHQRPVGVRGQAVGQAAAEHDGRGARQQPPVVRGEAAEFLGGDVRPRLGEPQRLPARFGVAEPEEPPGLAADQRERCRNARPGQVLDDQLAGSAAGQPGGEHVVPEGVQHLRHRHAAAARPVAGPGDREGHRRRPPRPWRRPRAAPR